MTRNGPTFFRMTQQEVADKLGLSKSMVQRIEASAGQKICRVLLEDCYRDLRREFTTDAELERRLKAYGEHWTAKNND